MAEEAQDSETPVKNQTTVDSPDIESQIKEAMRSRVNHFKEQSDSLTFEGVRRLLENDLGLPKLALDVHKRFVKQCLLQCLEGAVGDNAPKDSGESGEKPSKGTKREAAESPEEHDVKNDMKEQVSEGEEKMEDSPVMGLLTGKKTNKSETEEASVDKNKDIPSEDRIKKALWKKASYIKANSGEVTMAGLRRLLEEDLGLDKHALDPFKKFISKQLDEILQSSEVSEPKKKNVKGKSQGKASAKKRAKESSESSDRESEEEDEDEEEAKPKKKIVPKQKMQNSEGSKKRKRIEKDSKVSGKKRTKSAEKVGEDGSDVEDSGNASEDSNSQSSVEKPVKKKEASTPSYGKRVEHLKSVIKSCGMSVPPVIYKKVKQVPENKREAQLIKELEEILSKEGLSSNPSEKEIKEIRKKKERAKELEGIDTSNIVLSSRRRSTTSYAPPPKPKIPVESGSDDSDEEEEEDDDEDDEEEEVENDEEGENDGDEESQSEEEDAEDSD